MANDELLQHLRRRPAVHQLCSGAFLQEPIWLSEDIVAVVLLPLGFKTQAEYTARYAHEIAAANVDAAAVSNLAAQGSNALPVIAIARFFSIDATPENLESVAAPDLEQARRVLGWASADEVTPFASVTLTTTESFFRLVAPHSRLRQRLGFGNTGVTFHSQIARIIHAAKEDEHFEFALSLHHDALRETNPQFRIARLFNCLECLAYKLKGRHEEKSRRAVKDLLGLEDGASVELYLGGVKYRYDAIEIAGRIRDKLFHGVAFQETDLNEESRPAFYLYTNHPDQIVNTIQGYCEMEIARWANGASRGLVAP